MIQAHTTHDIYNLKGEMSDKMVTGQTGGISELTEFEWYCWLMLYDIAVSFLNHHGYWDGTVAHAVI